MSVKDYLLPGVLILAGLVLIATSIAWSKSVPGNSNWTPQKAQQYEKAARDFHALASTPPSEETNAARQEAEQHYQQLRTELEAARGSRVRWGLVLQMLGVGLALVGSVALIVRQNQAEDRKSRTA